MKADSLSMTDQPAQWIFPSLPQTLTVLFAPTHAQIKMQVTQMNVHTNVVLKPTVWTQSLYFSLNEHLSLIICNMKKKNSECQHKCIVVQSLKNILLRWGTPVHNQQLSPDSLGYDAPSRQVALFSRVWPTIVCRLWVVSYIFSVQHESLCWSLRQ